MRLPNTAHTTRPWRIHDIAADFHLEDVWALDTPGGPEDFERLVRQFASGDAVRSSRVVRTLIDVRFKLGALLALDEPESGVGAGTASLREELPADLRDGPRGPGGAFAPVYLTDDEWVGERANRTVHALAHLSWIPDGAGGYRGQLAVLVKPKGLLGRAYMAGIRPIRWLLVEPALVRAMARRWRAARPTPATTTH